MAVVTLNAEIVFAKTFFGQRFKFDGIKSYYGCYSNGEFF